MSIRGLIIALLLSAALGLAWHQRAPLQAWAGSASLPSVPSLGGNEPPRLTADATAPKGASKFRSGDLRKCVNGQQVAYSNVECPPGSKEQAVTAAAVTVLPATPVSKPSVPSSAPAALRTALDVEHRGDTLTDKAIERAVNGGR